MSQHPNFYTELECTQINFDRLVTELSMVKTQLRLKDIENKKLWEGQKQVDSEVHDLTASLFEEAHKMVEEANLQRQSTERVLTESRLKIDALQTEVDALRAVVLTSTPSRPNRHLHTQLQHSKPKHSTKSTTAGRDSISDLTSPEKLEIAVSATQQADPVAHKELADWRKLSQVDDSSPFVTAKDFLMSNSAIVHRIVDEDVKHTLSIFNNEKADMRVEEVIDAICRHELNIDPHLNEGDGVNNHSFCELHHYSGHEHKLLAKYRLTIKNDGSRGGVVHKLICKLDRNRIVSVCDCINFLKYVKQGMLKKTPMGDLHWRLTDLRLKMKLASLGYDID